MMEQIYLSKRNILALLQKLDSARNGEPGSCTIIKNDTAHPIYPQTIRRVAITAVDTEDRFFPGVSPRMQLSRQTLDALLARLARFPDNALDIDGIRVFAVPDEQYYVDSSAAQSSPVGDLASAFIRSRGKQT